MYRLLGFILLLVPLTCISSPGAKSTDEAPNPSIQTWNPETLPWSTVLIWTERSGGTSITTGVLINKAKRWVLATRHSLDNARPDQTATGITDTTYVVWPAAQPDSRSVIQTSDHYFRLRREKQLQPARILAEDAARDIVLLEAATPPPEWCRELSLELNAVSIGARLLGIAQPFTRGGLWHPFEARIEEQAFRRLSYSPSHRKEAVALYVARGEEPAEFGYSGSPLVLPHSGKLVGMLLAAQLEKPQSYVLISSQEIQKLLPIE